MNTEERIVPHEHEHLTRQLDLIPIEVLNQQINVIGAGAIGSVVVMTLAKMGFNNIMVFDDDEIDRVNISNQYYRFSDIGKYKVEALAEIVKDFTNVDIIAIPAKWENTTMDGIVITAVDNMSVRKAVFETHKNENPKTKLIIDPRMSAEKALMYVYNPLDSKSCSSYSNSLYSDNNAVQERCTAKATMFTSNMLGGLVAKTVKNITCGDDYSTYISWDIKNDDFYVGKRSGGNTDRDGIVASQDIPF